MKTRLIDSLVVHGTRARRAIQRAVKITLQCPGPQAPFLWLDGFAASIDPETETKGNRA